jgi:Ran GTPase-activating protein (RanGAP) involved in mRNA processing and transport
VTDADAAATVICDAFSETICQCIGALDLSALDSKVDHSGFDADEFCAVMARALSSTVHSISTLNMSRNALKTSTIRNIQKCISSSPSIIELNLSHTKLQFQDANVIASIIEFEPHKITVSRCQCDCFDN